jgi:hypothetical protein
VAGNLHRSDAGPRPEEGQFSAVRWGERFELDDGNVILVSRAKQEAPGLSGAYVRSHFQQLADALRGVLRTGSAVIVREPSLTTVGGATAIDATVRRPARTGPGLATWRQVFVYDGARLYFIGCTSSGSNAKELEEDCQRLLDTFRID